MAFLENMFVDINRYEFSPNRYIGEGAYGQCFIIIDKTDPEKLLCAKIHKDYIREPADQEVLLREVVILKNVKHNAILAFKGFNLYDFQQNPKPTIITEYMCNGSLDKILDAEKEGNPPASWNDTKRFICIIGITAAMRYLHRRNLMHRDLKPANILLDENFYPKVCDFGSSKEASQNSKEPQGKKFGTLLYNAPEVLTCSSCTKKVDVYSYAILVYEIVTKMKPFEDLYRTNINGLTNYNLKNYICRQKKRPLFEISKVEVNPFLRKLIEKCWSQDPDDRPSFDNIYDQLVDDSRLVISDQVNLNEVRSYVNTINDDSEKGGKAKLDISQPESQYDYRPSNNTNDIIPNDEKSRIKMLNDFVQNGFAGDVNIQITLFIKMLGFISTSKDPKSFARITIFANRLFQDGNEKASIFLKNAFGPIIGEGKKTFSKSDIPNTKATSLNISPTVEIIEEETFSGLKNLLFINLPPQIKKIGKNAFKDCKNLVWINLSNKIEEIEQGTFEGCHNLKYIEFPASSLKIIKEDAFRKCTSLDQIHIPNSVTMIEKGTFNGCKNLRIVHMSASTKYSSELTFPLKAQIINQ